MKLTPKQKAFADYYIELGNATQAAIKAGYSKKSAYAIGEQNLKKLEVKKYIEERNKEFESKKIATITEVKEFWTNVLRNDGIEYKDRLKASEFIAKTNGAFLDKVEHSGNINNPFENLTDNDLKKLIRDG